MKATELMVGDWVMYNPNVFIEDEYETTKECYPTKIYSGWDIELAIKGCYIPIALTSEILINSGFESQSNSHFYYDDEYSEIDIHELTDSVWLVECEDLEFSMPSQRMIVCNVHELQHALRLCQIDKTIEL